MAETKPRLVVDGTANRNGDAVLLQFVATTRAMRATAALLFDTNILFVGLFRSSDFELLWSSLPMLIAKFPKGKTVEYN